MDFQKEKDNTKYLKISIIFYQALADRSQKAGVVVIINLFLASVDEVGIQEMKPYF